MKSLVRWSETVLRLGSLLSQSNGNCTRPFSTLTDLVLDYLATLPFDRLANQPIEVRDHWIRQVVEAAGKLQIAVHDHLIIGRNSHVSFKVLGLL